MERLLRPRLGATVMELNLVESAQRLEVSRSQADAIVEICRREPGLPSLSDERRDALLSLASRGCWEAQDWQRVSEALSQKKIIQPAKNRRPLQHWAPNIFSYLTAAGWQEIKASKSMDVAEAIVTRRILELGGRTLSEPTLKCVSSFILRMANPNATLLPPASKYTFFLQIKKGFRTKARRCGKESDRAAHAVHLPPFPEEFKNAHSDLFAKVFHSGPPVTCAAPLGTLIKVNQSYKYRNPGPAMLTDSLAASGGDAGMLALMQQMMALQQQSFAIVNAQGRPERSIAALASLAAPPPAPSPDYQFD